MMMLTTSFLSLAGFAVLALSMRRHHRELFGEPPAHARRFLLRAIGWTLLGLSMVLAISSWGVSIGIALWFGVATLSVLAIALAITYRLESGNRERAKAGDLLAFRNGEVPRSR